jgi:hypothetical protein
MRVRVVRLFSDLEKVYYPSQVLDIRDAVAREYIAASLVVPVTHQEQKEQSDAKDNTNITTNSSSSRRNRRK